MSLRPQVPPVVPEETRRVAEWFAGTPIAKTRTSRFAALKPAA